MPLFTYSAAKRTGEIIKGEKEAENTKTLAHALKAENLFLLDAKEKTTASVLPLKIDVGEVFARLRPISLAEKMFLSRNLSVMISAGLSLTHALGTLAAESTNPKFRKILDNLVELITQGTSFADSLRMHKNVFGELFINMVEVGELTGKLALVLKLSARQMKKDFDLRSRVRSAMMYPAIIVIALGIIGTLMMLYVVPTLTQTIKELEVEIPATTQFIIFVSDLITRYASLGIGIAGTLIFMVWRIAKSTKGKTLFDRIVLHLPIFGSLVKKFNTARFCRTFAYLIAAGVSTVRSLDVTATVVGNSLFRDAIATAARDIQKGEPLHLILSRYPYLFQKMVIQMVGVGEETGKIAAMLLRLAIFFEEEVNETTKNLSTIIEPILMILIGAVVGFFAISMLQPIYSSLGNI